MNSVLKLLSLILVSTLLCASSYASSINCLKIQNECNQLQTKYASIISAWKEINFDTVPADIMLAEDNWHTCLKTKKENGCYKK